MRDFFCNDDPIQEIGKRSIFKKRNCFEEDDEYNLEKEMENYKKGHLHIYKDRFFFSHNNIFFLPTRKKKKKKKRQKTRERLA